DPLPEVAELDVADHVVDLRQAHGRVDRLGQRRHVVAGGEQAEVVVALDEAVPGLAVGGHAGPHHAARGVGHHVGGDDAGGAPGGGRAVGRGGVVDQEGHV